MRDLNAKERFVLSMFKELIEADSFDEIDIYSFLIYIRPLFDNSDKGLFENICEVCDFVAHRQRDRGKTQKGIVEAIANKYETLPNSNRVKGLNGIHWDKWEKEWNKLGNELNITISEPALKNISICVLSMLQSSVILNSNNDGGTQIAVLEVYQGENQLSLLLTEGDPDSRRVVYFVIKDLAIKKYYKSPFIQESLFAKRIEGQLHLVNTKDEMII